MFGLIYNHSIVYDTTDLQPQPDQLRTVLKYKDQYQNDVFDDHPHIRSVWRVYMIEQIVNKYIKNVGPKTLP